jgi:hypothetical protein
MSRVDPLYAVQSRREVELDVWVGTPQFIIVRQNIPVGVHAISGLCTFTSTVNEQRDARQTIATLVQSKVD